MRERDLTLLKATMLWAIFLFVLKYFTILLTLFPLNRLRLPTRPIGIVGTLINHHSLWGHALPLQAFLPGSIEPHLAYRHRFASFENFDPRSFFQILNIIDTPGSFPDLHSVNLFSPFASLKHIPLLVICSKHDTLVNFQDSFACFSASQSECKSSVIFGHDSPAFPSLISSPSLPLHAPFLQSCFLLAPILPTSYFGHLDLVLGSHSPNLVWPLLSSWLDSVSSEQQ